jgi:hypothetical protein
MRESGDKKQKTTKEREEEKLAEGRSRGVRLARLLRASKSMWATLSSATYGRQLAWSARNGATDGAVISRRTGTTLFLRPP